MVEGTKDGHFRFNRVYNRSNLVYSTGDYWRHSCRLQAGVWQQKV